MGFSWSEDKTTNLSAMAVEIRDNIDWLDDNVCSSDNGTYVGAEKSLNYPSNNVGDYDAQFVSQHTGNDTGYHATQKVGEDSTDYGTYALEDKGYAAASHNSYDELYYNFAEDHDFNSGTDGSDYGTNCSTNVSSEDTYYFISFLYSQCGAFACP